MADSVAHIVHPASKLHDVILGPKSRVKSLCGAFVMRASGTTDPVCRKCFDLYNDGRFNDGEPGGGRET